MKQVTERTNDILDIRSKSNQQAFTHVSRIFRRVWSMQPR